MSPLRKARIAQTLTIYDVARRAACRAGTVSRAERGYPVSATLAAELVKAVGCGLTEEMVLFPSRFPKWTPDACAQEVRHGRA